MLNSSRRSFLEHWRLELEQAGFRQTGPDGSFRYDGISFEMQDGWASLRSRRGKASNPSSGPCAEAAGLWRIVRTGASGRDIRLFEFPPAAFDAVALSLGGHPESPSRSVSAFGETLAWALGTEGGAPPAGWSPPERGVVEEWIPADALTVSAGAFVRQGALIHGPGRLAFRFPVIPEVPPDLSPSRKQWLEALMADAQDRWRLVRIETRGARLLAEVDLSGAPAAILQPLVRTALDALRWVVAWAGPPAALICDAAAPSEILESFVNP